MANAMSWVEEEDELEEAEDDEDRPREEDLDDDRLETITGPISLPTPALIPTAVAPHAHHPQHVAQPIKQQPEYKPRGMHTDLSQSYRWRFLDDDNSDDVDEQHRSALSVSNVRDTAYNEIPVISLVTMWKSSVRPFQYRFANPKYFQELCQIMLSDPDVQAVTRSKALYSDSAAPPHTHTILHRSGCHTWLQQEFWRAGCAGGENRTCGTKQGPDGCKGEASR